MYFLVRRSKASELAAKNTEAEVGQYWTPIITLYGYYMPIYILQTSPKGQNV